jgi:hypothetical protein
MSLISLQTEKGIGVSPSKSNDIHLVREVQEDSYSYEEDNNHEINDAEVEVTICFIDILLSI